MGRAHPITPATTGARRPAFSPDGTRIALASDRMSDVGCPLQVGLRDQPARTRTRGNEVAPLHEPDGWDGRATAHARRPSGSPPHLEHERTVDRNRIQSLGRDCHLGSALGREWRTGADLHRVLGIPSPGQKQPCGTPREGGPIKPNKPAGCHASPVHNENAKTTTHTVLRFTNRGLVELITNTVTTLRNSPNH